MAKTKPTKSKKPAPKKKLAPAATAAATPRDARLPPDGAVIEKRDRHGAVRCKCTVEEGGIRYGGKVYRSLSGAAMAAAKDLGLTNKTQNGFFFWGLDKPAGDPLAALERAWTKYAERAKAAIATATEETKAKVQAAVGKHAEALKKLA